MPMPNHCIECDCPTDNSNCICNQCDDTVMKWVSPRDPGDENVQKPVYSTTSRHILPSEEEEIDLFNREREKKIKVEAGGK